MNNLKKVTDPSILKQLNSGTKKVTDPAILNKLNAPEEENENLFQKVIKYGLKDPAIGFMNMGREFANLPHKVTGGYLPEYSPSNFNFEEALGVENPNSVDKLIQGISQYAPAFALPGANIGKVGTALESIPAIGRFASKAASEALPQAYYSAIQNPGHEGKAAVQAGATMTPFSVLGELMGSTNPKIKTLAKVLAGGGAGLLAREGAKQSGVGETMSDILGMSVGALGARGMSTKNDMMKNLTEGVSPEISNPRIAAANRLGLEYLTPAEAGVSPWAAKRQGALGRTEEGGKLLYEKGIQRQASERRAIDKTLNQIYSPGKMDKQVEEAYKNINEVNLPQEFPLQFKDNEIIKEAKKMVESTPAYKESLKSLMPKNVKLKPGQSDVQSTSLVYWDHIKRAMDDMVNKAERTGNKNEARIISDTRAKMRDQMDAAYPEYKAARSLYERKMVRQGLEKVFDQKEVNGTNFYRALASEKKFDDLIGHLKNAPEAAQNLKDMRLLFKDLMGPPTIKTAKGTEERGMNQARNEGDFLKHLLEHSFTKGGNDKAAIEFITSKDWGKQMKEINKISNKQLKVIAIGLGLSKGIAQYAGQSD
jgi:hypothetical protein